MSSNKSRTKLDSQDKLNKQKSQRLKNVEEDEDFFASLDKQDQDIKPFNERNKNKSKNGFDFTNIIDFVKQNTIYTIWGAVISVLIIALVAALASDAGNKNGSTVKDNKETGNKLIKNKNKEIDELINTYFTSRVSCDVDKLSGIMDSVENISADTLQNESKYIEGYNNIECYTKKGLADNEFVVYVYYENKILNIDTLAPGAVILYVKKDEEKGVYRIHNGINDIEISQYISKLSEDSDIKKFNKDVDEKLKKACDNDTDLKAFYDALISASHPAADETSPAENATPEAATESSQDVQQPE